VLRQELFESVPQAREGIPRLLRTMRLIARRSQAEYAKMCGVAPRVLANIESGKGSPTVETLEKLLRPFGYRVGVVAPVIGSEGAVTSTTPGQQPRAGD